MSDRPPTPERSRPSLTPGRRARPIAASPRRVARAETLARRRPFRARGPAHAVMRRCIGTIVGDAAEPSPAAAFSLPTRRNRESAGHSPDIST